MKIFKLDLFYVLIPLTDKCQQTTSVVLVPEEEGATVSSGNIFFSKFRKKKIGVELDFTFIETRKTKQAEKENGKTEKLSGVKSEDESVDRNFG